MSDRKVRKLKDKAASLVEREKFDRALRIYEELLQMCPKETPLMLKVGDINRRLGHNQAAVESYSRAASIFASDGMLLKGIAVCKIILDIDPHHTEMQQQLVDLYTSRYGAVPVKRTPVTADVDAETPVPSETEGRISELSIDVDLSGMESPAVDTLPEIPLFSNLDRDLFVALLSRIPLHRFDAGMTVVQERELGDSFFILVEGGVRIVKGKGISLAELGPGSFFGEMAIIAPHRRRASVITTVPSEILEVPKSELDGLTRHHPQIYNVLSQFTEQRLLQNLMVTSALFAPFSPDDRTALMEKFEAVRFLRGRAIIEQGKDADGLFLIVSGAVDIERDDEVIATLSEGELFGEISLLLRSKATATVRAAENTRVLLLSRGLFNELIMTHPQILELVSELKEERTATASHGVSLPRDLVSELDGGGALL